jgi:hypothetical protein
VGKGEIKENGGGVNSSMIYLIIVRTFVNATMYPNLHSNKKTHPTVREKEKEKETGSNNHRCFLMLVANFNAPCHQWSMEITCFIHSFSPTTWSHSSSSHLVNCSVL